MPLIPFGFGEKEKALVYLIFKTNRFYAPLTFAGLVIGLLTLFAGPPTYLALVSPLLGLLLAYLDLEVLMTLLSRKRTDYSQGFDWYAMVYPYRNIFPFALFRKNHKELQRGGLAPISTRARITLYYEGYKCLFLVFSLIPFFLISKKASEMIFSWGLSICFWGLFYTVFWWKVYLWKAGRILSLTEARVAETKEFLKKSEGKNEET